MEESLKPNSVEKFKAIASSAHTWPIFQAFFFFKKKKVSKKIQ